MIGDWLTSVCGWLLQGERVGKSVEDDVINSSIMEILNNAPLSDDGNPEPLPHPLQVMIDLYHKLLILIQFN